MSVVLAQSDLVTAYGWGVDALWNGLLSGKTAVTSSPRFSTGAVVSHNVALIPDLNVEPGESRTRATLRRLLKPLIGKLDPTTTLILATTVCEIEFVEKSILEKNPELAKNANPTMLLGHIKQLLGLRGPAMVISSACASSSAALARAASMIERGTASSVLVVACDAVSEFVYAGFSTLLSLCDTPARPFDANHCGLSLGEAAAWALVTSDDSALAGKDSVAILGWASSTDAVHMTAPDRAARGLSRAIESACSMAKVPPEKISFIAAHGTATLYNDSMELLAFGNSIGKPIPIFSVKGGTGHTLAAAGLTQILMAARAMKLRVVPPTVGLSIPDAQAVGWAHIEPVQLGDDPIALSSNSGFGGVNTAILLGTKSAGCRLQKGRPPPCSPSIRAIAWFCETNCGAIASNGSTCKQQSPPIQGSKEMTALIGRSVKYFPRMTSEARSCLAAASLAMKAAGWNDSKPNLGILGTGYDGCLAADQEFFRDYVAGGQSLGRANLFIYTLPTSAMSEVAIALTLTGPALHLSDGGQLIPQAISMIENYEAQGILCVFSDGPSAICVAVGNGEPIAGVSDFRFDRSPSEMCRALSAMVPQP